MGAPVLLREGPDCARPGGRACATNPATLLDQVVDDHEAGDGDGGAEGKQAEWAEGGRRLIFVVIAGRDEHERGYRGSRRRRLVESDSRFTGRLRLRVAVERLPH